MEDFILEQMFEDDDENMLTESSDNMLDDFDRSDIDDDGDDDDVLENASSSDLLDCYEGDVGDDDRSMLEMSFDSDAFAQMTRKEMPNSSRISPSPQRNVSPERQSMVDGDVILSDSLLFTSSKDYVIQQVESVFENIAVSLNNESTLSIMIRAKPSSMSNPRARTRKTALHSISFPGKTAKEAWRFSIMLPCVG